jgi:hypothetical protein
MFTLLRSEIISCAFTSLDGANTLLHLVQRCPFVYFNRQSTDHAQPAFSPQHLLRPSIPR